MRRARGKHKRSQRVADDVGEHIRSVRVAFGLTQQRMADACGCTRAAIALFEIGRATPSITMLYDMARALGIDPREMLLPGAP